MSYHDCIVNTRIKNSIRRKLERHVKKHDEKYDSLAQFVRVAVLKLGREEGALPKVEEMRSCDIKSRPRRLQR